MDKPNPPSRDRSPRGKKRASSELSCSSGESGCRPWDREDLSTRLATFKSMTWFGKPKVISAVNCARRGWVNVEMDMIACKACGANLIFSHPPSWTQQQIEKAAAVFSLKLDNGHKLLCPWINNACDESLAQLPPIPTPALVDGYRKRASTLLQLSALPIISSSAIVYMSCSQLERFLEQSSVDFGIGSIVTGRTEDLDYELEASANLYYQAQKLISLCGWEPRSLPYAVECNGWSTQSAQNRYSEERSSPVLKVQKSGGVMHLMSNVDGEDASLNALRSDPASIVLDCKLCGASAGLWAFSTVQRPLEWFRIVESLEVSGQNDASNSDDIAIGCIASTPRLDDSSDNNNIGHNAGTVKAPISIKESLNSSIAGGALPAKQNYRATVSLPMISRHLGAALSSKSDDRLQQESIQTTPCKLIVQSKDIETIPMEKNGEELGVSRGNSHLNVVDPSKNEKNCGTSLEGCSVVGQGPMGAHENNSQGEECNTIAPDGYGTVINGNVDGISMTESSSQQLDVVSSKTTQMFASVSSNAEANMITVGACTMSSQKDNMGSCHQNLFGLEGANGKLHGVDKMQHNENLDGFKHITELAVNNENVAPRGFVKDRKRVQFDLSMEFDPIRLHRHFCPWILPNGKTQPGWQLTLSALDLEKASPPLRDSSHFFISEAQVEYAINSVQNLSESPVARTSV